MTDNLLVSAILGLTQHRTPCKVGLVYAYIHVLSSVASITTYTSQECNS